MALIWIGNQRDVIKGKDEHRFLPLLGDQQGNLEAKQANPVEAVPGALHLLQ